MRVVETGNRAETRLDVDGGHCDVRQGAGRMSGVLDGAEGDSRRRQERKSKIIIRFVLADANAETLAKVLSASEDEDTIEDTISLLSPRESSHESEMKLQPDKKTNEREEE